MDLERHVDCPPLVQPAGDQRPLAYLLAWLWVQGPGEWRAVVT